MTHQFRIVFVVLAISAIPSSAQEGLHNSTKKFTEPKDMTAADWSDPVEIRRTWDAALVRIPAEKGVVKTTIRKLAENAITERQITERKKFPTVIYLHGCSGVWPGTYRRIDFLASNGFAVIAPVSFARKKYPKSCDTVRRVGGLYRPTLKMRQNDAGFAIAEAKKLDWVDPENVFLIGLSQGGITTATFQSKDSAAGVRARVVEGWTCHAGWAEYRGINAPDTEPVLTLVGEKDPWFQQSYNRGDCSPFLNKANGSQSVVFKTGKLQGRHELLESKEAQRIVLDFLRKHLEN